MTSWAGPLTGHLLALLGRGASTSNRPPSLTEPGWSVVCLDQGRILERGPIFAALNTNKKSLTIDFHDPRDSIWCAGSSRRATWSSRTSPRVLDQLGLDYETLKADRPDLVMVRMPGFGLDGPWRDLSAFAFVIEDASGLTWLTGHPDLLPFEPYTIGDPNAGLHALFGLMVALEHRAKTGEGGLVEAAMVDAGLNVAAEQVIEASAYGALLARDGNRGPTAAPQNLYQAAGPDENGRDDAWVAVAVATDGQWESLRAALGEPEWAADPGLANAAGRARAHDQIDGYLREWCRARSADEVVERLWDAGVPVGKVVLPHRQPELAQLAFRDFFEEVDHPVIGRSRYSTLPMRFSRHEGRLHERHAPLLGEHNEELLGEIGLTRSEIDVLEAEGIIGGSLLQDT